MMKFALSAEIVAKVSSNMYQHVKTPPQSAHTYDTMSLSGFGFAERHGRCSSEGDSAFTLPRRAQQRILWTGFCREKWTGHSDFFSLLGEFCALHLFLPKWDASPWREFCFTFFNHQTSKSKFPCNRGGGLSAHYKDSLFFELFQPSKKQIKGNHRRLDFWLAGLFWSDENMAWRSMGFFYGWGRCLDLFNAIFYRFYRGKSPSNHHLGKTPPKFHSEKWWLEGRRSFPLPIVNGTFQGRTRC